MNQTLTVNLSSPAAEAIKAAAGSLAFAGWSQPGTKDLSADDVESTLAELTEIEANLTGSWNSKRPIRALLAKVKEFADSLDLTVETQVEDEAPEGVTADGEVIEKNAEGLVVKFTAREQWLQAATEIFRTWFADRGFELPENIRVSCGLAGSNIRSKTLGECWSDHCSADAAREVFLSPVLDDPSRVLDVLIHELCHTLYPVSEGHGRNFVKTAKALGLTGKMTATVASDELFEALKPVIEQLGAYPHAALTSMKDRKVQTTRMIKVICPAEGCDYAVRMTKKHIGRGFPTCPCGEVMISPDFDPTPGEDDDEDGGGE